MVGTCQLSCQVDKICTMAFQSGSVIGTIRLRFFREASGLLLADLYYG